MNYLITIARLKVQMLCDGTFRQCFADGVKLSGIFINKALQTSTKMIKRREYMCHQILEKSY